MKTKITLLVLTALLGLTNVFANSMPTSENSVENEMTTSDGNMIFVTAGKRIYTLDMNTYHATLVATSPYVNEINSIASDATTGWLFYVSNHLSRYNWTIYGYNVFSNTHKDFGSVRHYFTATGHARSSRGLASGGATFYNGKLYFAMEYPVRCYYHRDGRRTTTNSNSNPKDELDDNPRGGGSTSVGMFTSGSAGRGNNATTENTDPATDNGRDGNGETPDDFVVIDDEEVNALNDNVVDYISEEELPQDPNADAGLQQRGHNGYTTEHYYNSSYNNNIYLLEICFSGLTDTTGQSSAVTNGRPVYDPWWYSSFLYRGELGDIVVDDNGQMYAATSYQVQAYNFNTNRYDWANNEDVYAQMAKDKHSHLHLLKNRKYYTTYYYHGCPQNVFIAKSFVQKYTPPSNLRTFNNIQLGSLIEISGLNSNDKGRITDACDYIDLTPPVSYKIKGIVYDDNDEDGNIDSGETATQGVTVTLYADNNNDNLLDSGDTVINSQVTDGNGSYEFNNVDVAETLVAVTVPSNTPTTTYTATTPEVVAVSGGTNDVTVDFGINEALIPVNYDVFGTVYDDDNADAVLDAGEAGLPNVTLTLYADNNADGALDAGDTVINTTTSAADGTYSFVHVCIQNTIVAVTVPTNTGDFTYVLTTAGTQAIDSINTDVTGVDFGINQEQVINYGITGNVFDDDNENGINDVENGIENITLTLYADNNADGVLDSGDTVITTTTSVTVDGFYEFLNVTVANTIVAVTVPADTADFTYTLTTPVAEAVSGITTDITGVDFGINEQQVINYAISGNVYDDNDESGAQDAGEDNLESITVTLYADNNADGLVDAGDTVISTATTAADGTYSFAGVTAPNTVVAVTVPADTADFTYTLTTAGVINTSSTNTNVDNVNFGINEVLVINYAISGNVYDDNDESGAQDAGEDNLASITVTLYADNNADGLVDAGDTVISTATTAADGTYSFAGVTEPNTVVAVTVPGNTPDFTYTLTTPGVINTSSTNTNVDNVNFGINEVLVIDYNISGTVFDDDNANGTNDAEAGLGSVTVTLYADNNADGTVDAGDTVISTATSATDGTYSFTGVTVQNTVVEVTVPADTATFTYVLTTAGSVNTSSTITDVTGVDFGINEEQVILYNISGTVFDDDDASGVRDAGEGFIGATLLTLYADNDGDGVIGAGDTVITTTTTSSMSGTYSFTGITVANTLVEVTVPTDTATFTYVLTTPGSQAVSSVNTDVNGVDFGVNREVVVNYNIFGTVYDDDNENGALDAAEPGRLENVTLTLYVDDNGDGRVGTGDTILGTTTTAADGTYSFLNVTTANTLVAVSVPQNNGTFNYFLTTAARVDTSSVNTDVTNVDFGINEAPASYDVSGNIFNDENADGINAPAEAGLLGVTVNLFEDVNGNGRIDRGEPLIATAVSDRSGNYLFAGITASNVIVQLIVPANTAQFTYLPTTPVSVVLSGGVSTTVDFGINRQIVILYNISGVVWDDQNEDQIKDAGEPRLGGVGVTLFEDVNANGALDATDRSLSTIVSATNGSYQFSNVTLRNVIIVPSLPQDGTFTTPNNRAISSINTDAIDVDFGIKIADALFQVTGVVFDDQNENGIIDAGENSIDGLPVEIYSDSDGDGVLDTNMDLLVAFTQTSNSGFGFLNPNYLVDDIPPGQVFIRVVIPDDTIFTTYTPTFDPDSGTAAPDGVFPTFMTGDLDNINFGLKISDSNSTSRMADGSNTMFTTENASDMTIQQEDVSERLRLYPNPSVREIAINADEFAGEVTVEIYNNRGYRVMATSVSSFGSEYRINVQRLAPGMYYAKFAARNKVATKQFIKR